MSASSSSSRSRYSTTATTSAARRASLGGYLSNSSPAPTRDYTSGSSSGYGSGNSGHHYSGSSRLDYSPSTSKSNYSFLGGPSKTYSSAKEIDLYNGTQSSSIALSATTPTRRSRYTGSTSTSAALNDLLNGTSSSSATSSATPRTARSYRGARSNVELSTSSDYGTSGSVGASASSLRDATGVGSSSSSAGVTSLGVTNWRSKNANTAGGVEFEIKETTTVPTTPTSSNYRSRSAAAAATSAATNAALAALEVDLNLPTYHRSRAQSRGKNSYSTSSSVPGSTSLTSRSSYGDPPNDCYTTSALLRDASSSLLRDTAPISSTTATSSSLLRDPIGGGTSSSSLLRDPIGGGTSSSSLLLKDTTSSLMKDRDHSIGRESVTSGFGTTRDRYPSGASGVSTTTEYDIDKITRELLSTGTVTLPPRETGGRCSTFSVNDNNNTPTRSIVGDLQLLPNGGGLISPTLLSPTSLPAMSSTSNASLAAKSRLFASDAYTPTSTGRLFDASQFENGGVPASSIRRINGGVGGMVRSNSFRDLRDFDDLNRTSRPLPRTRARHQTLAYGVSAADLGMARTQSRLALNGGGSSALADLAAEWRSSNVPLVGGFHPAPSVIGADAAVQGFASDMSVGPPGTALNNSTVGTKSKREKKSTPRSYSSSNYFSSPSSSRFRENVTSEKSSSSSSASDYSSSCYSDPGYASQSGSRRSSFSVSPWVFYVHSCLIYSICFSNTFFRYFLTHE